MKARMTHHSAEQCCLADAVTAKHCQRIARRQGERNPIEYDHLAITGPDIGEGEAASLGVRLSHALTRSPKYTSRTLGSLAMASGGPSTRMRPSTRTVMRRAMRKTRSMS